MLPAFAAAPDDDDTVNAYDVVAAMAQMNMVINRILLVYSSLAVHDRLLLPLPKLSGFYFQYFFCCSFRAVVCIYFNFSEQEKQLPSKRIKRLLDVVWKRCLLTSFDISNKKYCFVYH